MQIVVTGHRPQKLGGFNNHKVHRKIHSAIWQKLGELKPDILYTGMALGVDQWAAASCIKLGIPYIACLPFQGQELKWSQPFQQYYNMLLKKAAKIVYVDRQPGYISTRVPPGVYHRQKMMVRNNWMVDQLEHGDKVLAVYLAIETNSGTAACVRYAEERLSGDINPIIHLRPETICPELDDDVPF